MTALTAMYTDLLHYAVQYYKIKDKEEILLNVNQLEYVNTQRRTILDQISCRLTQIKHKILYNITRNPQISQETEDFPDIKDIFTWLNPLYGYKEFLKNIKEKKSACYKSPYEEAEVKRRIIKYLKTLPERVLRKNISSEYFTAHKICTKNSVPKEKSSKTLLHLKESKEIQPGILNKSYCILCRRTIADKMRTRHSLSNAHKETKAIYLKLALHEVSRIDYLYRKYVFRHKDHIRNLLHKEIKHTKIKTIRLDKYLPRTKPERLKYNCEICKKVFTQEKEYSLHFMKKDHKAALHKLGVKEAKEFKGLATQESVIKRQEMYFARDMHN
ncbi:hypothetical protein NEAUS06_0440 [Nematocida ausubeli]|nr:hypothetical protein NEAUS06_0440 [Nematocida ausubeli]